MKDSTFSLLTSLVAILIVVAVTGGLLGLVALILMVCWNDVLSPTLDIGTITFGQSTIVTLTVAALSGIINPRNNK